MVIILIFVAQKKMSIKYNYQIISNEEGHSSEELPFGCI